MDVNGEFEVQSALILAAEDWAEGYNDTPTEFGKFLRLAGRLERQTLQFYKGLADSQDKFINWWEYSREVQAFDVQVIVNDEQLYLEEATFLQVVFDTYTDMVALGAQSQEVIAGIPLGLDSTSVLIQQLSTENLANLVGKKIDNTTGKLIDNPKAGMSIDETTRQRIAQSIKTSVRLGEKREQATSRLRQTIANAKRAEMIAQTEAVRAFGAGRRGYALNSGATGHKWNDNGAKDVCATNAAQGFIPINEAFASGHDICPAHPWCKCNVTYTYKPAAEW